MSQYFGVRLQKGRVEGVPKVFDLVSSEGRIVGDSKYLSMVRGERLPPAKFSNIAEHVWLLEKTEADRRFLVFGNDHRVPIKWLEKYGPLVSNVEFFFIEDEDESVLQLR